MLFNQTNQFKKLREYAQYVNCVRKYAKELELNEAVKLAVDECIRNNILSEFLRTNKSEVILMSIFEYDKEEEERKLRKAEYEAGFPAGVRNGNAGCFKILFANEQYCMCK